MERNISLRSIDPTDSSARTSLSRAISTSKTALQLLAATAEGGLGINNAFRIGGGTPELKQITTIFRSKAGRAGLSVALPEEMVRSFDLEEGDKLSWEVETREILGSDGLAKRTDIVIVVTPVWSSRKRTKPEA